MESQKFLYFSAPICQKHLNSWGHPECPERIVSIEQALQDSGLMKQAITKPFAKATDEDILRVHHPKVWQTLKDNVPQNGFVKIDEDTGMNAYSIEAALTASGAMLTAIDGVMNNEASKAFCNIRPPGHHAEIKRPMGFCLINHIAIGAAYALQKYQLQRIAIVDFDVHHGNGTEDYVEQDPRVGFVSSFQENIFPFTIPFSDIDNMLKLPLKAQSDDEVFMQAWQEGFEFVRNFKPQLILVSAGFDAHQKDPLANLNLTENDFYRWTQQLVEIADEVCEGKIISTLEGGYDLDALAASVAAHVKALLKQ